MLSSLIIFFNLVIFKNKVQLTIVLLNCLVLIIINKVVREDWIKTIIKKNLI